MSTPPVLIASDVHLGAISPERERAFVSWLEYAGAEADTLVLNGDLFDFWFEYRHAIPRGYTRVLGALAALVDGGLEIHLTGGNHDWWGGSYLEEEVGLTFHREPVELTLAGHRTWLAHGDGLGPGDVGYRVLKRILRHPLFVWAFRRLHPDTGARIAGRVSATQDRWTGPGAADRDRARILEEWALDRLERRPELDLMVLGHTHVPALRPARGPRRAWYLNSGDWVFHDSYAVLQPDAAPRLMSWRAGAPSPLPPPEPGR
jgi:UDP-2,3-diacylglucosamine hydrolase